MRISALGEQGLTCLIYGWISEIRTGFGTKESFNISAPDLTWLFFHSFHSSYSFQWGCLPVSPVTNFTTWLWVDHLTAWSFNLHIYKVKIRSYLRSLSGIKITSCHLIPLIWWLPTMVPKYISSDKDTNTGALGFYFTTDPLKTQPLETHWIEKQSLLHSINPCWISAWDHRERSMYWCWSCKVPKKDRSGPFSVLLGLHILS